MDPIDWRTAPHPMGWRRIELAKEQQDKYRVLPVLVDSSRERRMISCWQLTWRERWRLLWTGRLFLHQLTFGHKFQPVLLEVDEPKLQPHLMPDADERLA